MGGVRDRVRLVLHVPPIGIVGQDRFHTSVHRLPDQCLPLRRRIRLETRKLVVALLVRQASVQPGKYAQLGQKQDHELHDG